MVLEHPTQVFEAAQEPNGVIHRELVCELAGALRRERPR
jgi:hypothetical protein